ncbi:MAG: SNF2-related protein [Sphingobacterium sp.]|uniref:DEAD/DEAH box helicase n=1 Tax=Sphingobacterium sp. JB170 TaxID=1434842 RepID=UPI00097F26FE|nr:DEAD/DEAH box helicase [Sphingobacterium sp. JB170]SJN48509.1 Snf2 family protein [Sphingobacterium sp. JB170]
MRLTNNEYNFENFDFNAISEVYLLKHFQGAQVPGTAEVSGVKAIDLAINQGRFLLKDYSFPTAVELHVRQNCDELRISCTCGENAITLCTHEYATLRALQKNVQYKAFFDHHIRISFLRSQSIQYGLENEKDIEQYFRLQYINDNIVATPHNPYLIVPDPTLGNQITNESKHPVDAKLSTSPDRTQRILVISRHRFYDQLRFEVIDVGITDSGKLKSPLHYIDIRALLWKAQSAQETKFYAAINYFAQNYSDTESTADLQALHILQANPLNLPVYFHDREIAEKKTPRSLVAIKLYAMRGQIEISVVKKLPFYEIQAYFIHQEVTKNIHAVDIIYRYFIRTDDAYFLIDKLPILHTIEYFKSKPEKLLIHHSKYGDFLKSTLLPLEESLAVKYTYIRKATEKEKKTIASDVQQIIYLNQHGHYVNITPIMRYGDMEIPLFSKRNITAIDAAENPYQIKRDKMQEDLFLSRVTRMHPTFTDQLSEPTYFYLHYQQFLREDWFLDSIEYWKSQGITILGFQELEFTNRNTNKPTINIEILSGTKWFETKFNLQFGEQQVSVIQLYKSIRNKSKYIELDDGSIGIIPQDWLHKITRYFSLGILKSGQLLISKFAFSELRKLAQEDRVSKDILAELSRYSDGINNLKDIPLALPPTALKATLRDYQLQGVSWLIHLDRFNFGGCLADDMGLGKTVQIIAFLLYQKENRGPHTNLIVCPTSLVFNWQNEILKFAPTLSVLVLHGTDRHSYNTSMEKYDIVITTYGLMVSDINVLKKFYFNAVVLDESQAIKNPNSERNKKVLMLQSRTRYILTGTPIENSTFDLFGQLSFACPGILGSKQFFKDTYATPIDRFQDKKRLHTLHKKVEPFILRRTKKQVAKDLPEKTEAIILCEMGPVQRAIYETHQSALRDYLENNMDEELAQSSMHMLAGLTRLRQICNAPYLLKDGYDKSVSSKIDAVLEQLDAIAYGHKIIIFSQFVGMLELLKEALEKRDIPFEILTGATKNRAEVVNSFNENPQIRVFLVSLKAGGTGLNLTAADYVFLMDPWWNPAIENQAIDRIHRIGQHKNVVAVRFICPDTIEEKIIVMQNKKRQLATDLIKSESSFLQKIGRKTWIDILN